MRSALLERPRRAPHDRATFRFRPVFVAAEFVVAFAATVGAVQLITGTLTPPVADLAPLGLSTWVLPGLWLFSSVAIPSMVAGWLALRCSPRAPTAVLTASALLAFELLVQIPFVGPSFLQLGLGIVAVLLGAMALEARRRAWPVATGEHR